MLFYAPMIVTWSEPRDISTSHILLSVNCDMLPALNVSQCMSCIDSTDLIANPPIMTAMTFDLSCQNGCICYLKFLLNGRKPDLIILKGVDNEHDHSIA